MSRSERAAQRRRQILDRALVVFAERGFHGASVTHIVSAAGVARGTFYLYFDSKEAVFRELLDELLVTLRDSVRGVEVGPEAAPIEAQLRGVVVRLLRSTEANRALTRIVFREAVGLDAVVDGQLAGFHDSLHAWIVAALTVGEGLGLLRATDREVVATCVLGSVRELISRWVVERDEPFDAEQLAAGLVDFSLRGLSPR